MTTGLIYRFLLVAMMLPNLLAAEQQPVKYHDGKPDGHKSLGGSGEIIVFEAPSDACALKAIRIHGSRYGFPEAPDENFYIFVTGADAKGILHTETAPYERFERGNAKWVEVKFKNPPKLPPKFCVILDFRAQQTKGVYVSFDTSSGGKHSWTGLPDKEPSPVDFGADWMVEAVLEKP
ncbi:MAG TPA: hypothetical protein PLU30_22315 [Verrucomicrobiae bacterium]|nr:hypothetical protein [Verrucomicrobiae bacterium]